MKKLKSKGLTAPVLSKDTKPSLAARVSWMIQNMKETEQYAMTLYQCLVASKSKEIAEKIINVHISKWHRWFHIESLDLITVKLNQNQPVYGKEKLRDKIRTLGIGYFLEDVYVEIVNQSGIFIAKIN